MTSPCFAGSGEHQPKSIAHPWLEILTLTLSLSLSLALALYLSLSVEKHQPKSIVHPWLEICDIAGLVKGAAQGAGLGNAFLSHIRAVDGIVHVMRAFEDPDIVHVEDRVDPVGDIEIISSELRQKDLEAVERKLGDLNRDKVKANSNPAAKKEWEAEMATVTKLKEWLEAGKEVRLGVGLGDEDHWNVKDIK